LAKELGHGAEYRYAHDEDGGFAAGENYLPEALKDARFYAPRDAGLETRIAEKLASLAELNAKAGNKRYGK
ncbi:unnamed protein product, partial [Discosporangium mesarthrocarpum]